MAVGGARSETVLITGASAGLGWELAQLFAADGSRLILTARRAERLDELAAQLRSRYGCQIEVFPADLASPEAPQRVHDYLTRTDQVVDVLVNNAGFGAVGRFVELPLTRQLEMVQVNVTALVHLTGLVLPGMLQRNRGGILNLSSTAAFQAGPNMAVYYATKAFVQSFSEALQEETRGTGVVVTTFAPGATATDFGRSSGMDSSPFFEQHAMSAATVAHIGYRGFRRNAGFLIPGLKNRVATTAVKFLPRAWSRRIVERLKTLAR